eukprot:1185085-Prorocentrum_minimum.AAC.5
MNLGVARSTRGGVWWRECAARAPSSARAPPSGAPANEAPPSGRRRRPCAADRATCVTHIYQAWEDLRSFTDLPLCCAMLSNHTPRPAVVLRYVV